jgi:hypothetical protein
MSNNYEEIVGAAMSLPPATRAMLAEHLLASAGGPNQKGAEGAEQDSGKIKAVEPTITLALDTELERRLKQEADRQGLPLEEYVARVLNERISRAELERREKLVALVQSWIDEDEASSEEGYDEEFLRMIDEDRPSYRKLFPPELKGISW